MTPPMGGVQRRRGHLRRHRRCHGGRPCAPPTTCTTAKIPSRTPSVRCGEMPPAPSGWTEAEFDLGGGAVVHTGGGQRPGQHRPPAGRTEVRPRPTMTLWRSWPAPAAAPAAGDSPSTPTTWSVLPSGASKVPVQHRPHPDGSLQPTKTPRSTPSTGMIWVPPAANAPRHCFTPTTPPGRCRQSNNPQKHRTASPPQQICSGCGGLFAW